MPAEDAELPLAAEAPALADALDALADAAEDDVLAALDALDELDAALLDDDPHAASPIASANAQHVITIASPLFITLTFLEDRFQSWLSVEW